MYYFFAVFIAAIVYSHSPPEMAVDFVLYWLLRQAMI